MTRRLAIKKPGVASGCSTHPASAYGQQSQLPKLVRLKPEEVQFLERFLQPFFALIEQAEAGVLDARGLSLLVRQTVSINQYFDDLSTSDGGQYTELLEALSASLDAPYRIRNFALRCVEEIRFSRFIEDLIVTPDSAGPPPFVPSSDFLEISDLLSELEYAALEYSHFFGATSPAPSVDLASAMPSLLGFLGYLLAEHENGAAPGSFVFLLRDTLLTYFGMREVERLGYRVRSSPLFFSRAVLRKHEAPGSTFSFYSSVYSSLFTALAGGYAECEPHFLETFLEQIKRERPVECSLLRPTLEAVFTNYVPQGEPATLVESGLNGTMPLLVMAIFPQSEMRMRMFSAIPWLQSFFSGQIYTDLSSNVRPLERLSCQEHLARFAEVRNGKIFVEKNEFAGVWDRCVSDLAFYLNAVRMRFG